jgi:hypothetical protein
MRESADITRTQWQLMKRPEPAKIDVKRIIRTLSAKRIPFVLTGAHAIGGWTGEPRATKDVNILVKGGRNHARAVKALRELYPHLEVHTHFGVTGFYVPGDKQSVIDVTYPHRDDIVETLAHPIWVEDGDLRYRVPALEAALANKYGAMLTLSRDPVKRMQDATDFAKIVQYSTREGQQAVAVDRLRELGEKVWPGGGGDEILRLVEQVKHQGFLNLSDLYGTA